MSVLSSIGRLAAEYNAARKRFHTERVIRSLPIELQKDIGWPQISECVAAIGCRDAQRPGVK